MKLIHPVTGQLRSYPDRVLPARLQAARGDARPTDARPALRAAQSNGQPVLPGGLSRIIRPEAQPRWLLPSLALITPDYIEAILRGALVGNHLMQWQLFDLMEDTWPRLVKNLNELKEAAIGKLQNDWQIRAWSKKNEKPTPSATEKAALAEEAIFGIKGNPGKDENGFEETCYDILDAWAKGTSLLEVIWEQREDANGGQMLAPASTYWVHPRNYAWGADGRLGLLAGMTATASSYFGNTAQRMPSPYEGGAAEGFAGLDEYPDQFLVAVRKARTGHPLGGPLLRPLTWWWCAANFSADWLMNFAQIFGIPFRLANYAPSANQETVDKICNMLANMGSQAWGAFPAGVTIDVKEASRGSQESPQADLIDRAEKQCDLLILGNTLTSTVSRGGGSRALGEVQERKEEKNEDAAARFLARVFNDQLVPALLRLNYDDESEKPSFVKVAEEPEEAKANAEVLQVATAIGVPVPVSFALEKLNIPAAEEGEEILTPPTNPKMPNLGDGGGQDSMIGARAASLSATAKLVDDVVEKLTGIEARWLAGVKPYFKRLVLMAQSSSVSDAEFVQALKKAQRDMPDLFSKLDTAAVRDALDGAMGAAVVNGAVRGAMRRPVGSRVLPGRGNSSPHQDEVPA